MHVIDPLKDIGKDLLAIQNPARYLGGEFGQIKKTATALTIALAFPDLYEIAMSNLAIKILYNGLNKISSVRCERVFAPAPDFEQLLKKKKIPLYTLESGLPVCGVDIVAVSIGYESGINGLLSILDTGCVPLSCTDRTDTDPIVLAGGCGITNPLPFTKFIDLFFIGEAEGGFFEIIAAISELKKTGATRCEIIDELEKSPYIWSKRKHHRSSTVICARKAVYNEFGNSYDESVCLPVPNIRVVQDHGSVEIMRGCPNGCRFCHAGLFYRPQRLKDISTIIKDVNTVIKTAGYREISLMSLSSGDFVNIDSLMTELTSLYNDLNVSFQLPSLKVNSFTLPLLEKMASVRKSGLTFAVETPVDAWQLALNKEVCKQKIIDIILEAKRKGWNQCKFYFMIGLPVEQDEMKEEVEIVRFLLDVYDRTRMYSSVNIGTFIPKAHTPYQWSKQLTPAEAQEKIDYIYRNLPKKYFKLSTHKPFNSLVEGMISRGDERVGDVILDAYNNGCRLDAWDDWAKPDVWRDAISRADWNVEEVTTRSRDIDEKLPWDSISIGPSKSFLLKEKSRSENRSLSAPCSSICQEPCGVCNNATRVTENRPIANPDVAIEKREVQKKEAVVRVVVSFTKHGVASYIPHLSMLELWHKTFLRSSLPVVYSEGFNPLPKFELAQTLSLGISSDDEIGSFLLYDDVSDDYIITQLNKNLPESIRVSALRLYKVDRKYKRESLSKFLWGTSYRYTFFDAKHLHVLLADQNFQKFFTDHPEVKFLSDDDQLSHLAIVTLPFKHDRSFRDLISEILNEPLHQICSIHKAKSIAYMGNNDSLASFFDVLDTIDEIHTM